VLPATNCAHSVHLRSAGAAVNGQPSTSACKLAATAQIAIVIAEGNRIHHQPDRRLRRRILGWVLDAFDFFVMVFLFDTLAEHFHVRSRRWWTR
jgi:hypothetical protein